ncbi:hypothetical protein [Rhizobium terrae]|uniref:hypothetical protein n=1 Tax=Rhizobium terrae TaxID=2171756 RepID=UPI0013C3373C|nr:hypothetical protein [Rhizobium terrae]
MSEKISWSVNAGAAGGSLVQSGSVDCEAVTTVSVSIDAGGSKALDLQLEDISKVEFLGIKSSIYDGKLKVKASGTGAAEIALTGPVLLFRGGVALLGPSFETLTVKNEHAADAASVEILIASTLS